MFCTKVHLFLLSLHPIPLITFIITFMKHTYYPKGTCSQVIEFEVIDGIIHNVQFYGGCDGNTQGVGRLVEGMKAEEVVERLEGIHCGFKPTSCPDQLAKAIRQAMEEKGITK